MMLGAVLWLWLVAEPPGIIVVVAEDAALERLTQHQLQQVFLGTLDQVNDRSVYPVLLPSESATHQQFEKETFGAAFDLHAYWLTRKIKTGDPAPLVAQNTFMVIALLKRNPGFIGYLPKQGQDQLNQHGIKVVAISKK